MYSFDPKYFIYVNRTQVGPFLKNEIIDEIEKQNVGEDAHIWFEGMADWVKVKDLEELKDYVQYLPSTTALSQLQKRFQPIPDILESEPFDGQTSLPDFHDNTSQTTTLATSPTSFKKSPYLKTKGPLIFLGLILSVGVGLAVAYIYLSTKDDFWKSLDATPEQIAEIKSTIERKQDQNALFYLSKMKGNSREPQLVIATNLPDHTDLKAELFGIRSTLLGALDVHVSMKLKIENGMAIANPLRHADGTFLPLGVYKLRLTCSECSVDGSPSETWMPNPVFVGELNSSYQAELAQFRKIQQKQLESEAFELAESYRFLHQLIQDRLRKKTLTSQQTTMFAQLGEVLTQHSAEAISQHYVLAPLYRELLVIHQGLRQMPAELGILRQQLNHLKEKQDRMVAQSRQSMAEVLDAD